MIVVRVGKERGVADIAGEFLVFEIMMSKEEISVTENFLR
jgi:hypothetical protein